jgi:hypothetical protein
LEYGQFEENLFTQDQPFGITMAAMMYAQIPAPPKQVRMTHARRTSVGSMSKYSAMPPHTPHSI